MSLLVNTFSNKTEAPMSSHDLAPGSVDAESVCPKPAASARLQEIKHKLQCQVSRSHKGLDAKTRNRPAGDQRGCSLTRRHCQVSRIIFSCMPWDEATSKYVRSQIEMQQRGGRDAQSHTKLQRFAGCIEHCGDTWPWPGDRLAINLTL